MLVWTKSPHQSPPCSASPGDEADGGGKVYGDDQHEEDDGGGEVDGDD